MAKIVESEANSKLSDLYHKVLVECEHSKVLNLIITGEFPFAEVDSPWVQQYTPKAMEFQEDKKPGNLELNHGEYINKYKANFKKSGMEYLIDELRTKKDSNRACWCLYDMSTLLEANSQIHNKDKPIPSLLVLQAGISDDNSQIFITAYFRALEVKQFLPINIAECCLVAKELNVQLGSSFKIFSLTIHAFSAYVRENYACLEKAIVDRIDEAEIMYNIMKADSYREWLTGNLENKKLTVESRINPNGLETLLKCIELYNGKRKDQGSIVYKQELIDGLKKIITMIVKYNNIRFSSSFAKQAHDKYDEIKIEIDKAIKFI